MKSIVLTLSLLLGSTCAIAQAPTKPPVAKPQANIPIPTCNPSQNPNPCQSWFK